MRALTGLFLVVVAGCSLIYDPENCGSDTDCEGDGVCTDGICVGGGPLMHEDAGGDVGPSADAKVDAGEIPPDSKVPDTGPLSDAGDGGVPGDGATGDLGPDAEIRPPAPVCAFLTPEEDQRLTELGRVGVTVQVTPPGVQTVTLDEEPIELDEGGIYVVERPLREGENRFALAATDAWDRSCDAEIVVVADRTPPEVRLDVELLPVTNQTNLEARVRATDPSGIDWENVRISLRNLPFRGETAVDGDVMTFTLDLADGENAIEITVADLLGNAAEPIERMVHLDDVPPVVVISSPAPGSAFAERQVTITGTAEDPNGPNDRVRVEVTPHEAAGADPRTGRTVNAQMGIDGAFTAARVSLFPGENRVEVCADDQAGNRQCEDLALSFEADAPCIHIELPADGAVVGEADVPVSGTACHSVESVRVGVGDNLVAAVLDGRFNWTTVVHLPGQGAHTIRAVARSHAGQESEASVQLAWDDTPPQIEIERPVDGACLADDPVVICGRVADLQSNVTGVGATSGGQQVEGRPDPGGNFCLNLDLEPGPDQEVTVTATNAADLTQDAAITVTVDRTGPELSLAFEDGEFLQGDAGGCVLIEGRLQDAGCGLVGNSLSVSGQVVPLEADGGFSHRRCGLGEGELRLLFTYHDAVGNRGNRQVDFGIDATPPTIRNVTPEGEVATTDAQLTVSAIVNDGASGVTAVTIGGEEVVPVDEDGDLIARRDVPLVEGRNDIEIVVTDGVGLTQSAHVLAFRDLDDPNVAITAPQGGAAVEACATVTGTFDDGVDGSGVVEIRVRGEAAELDHDNGTWRYECVQLQGGDNRISAIAEDAAGNVSVPASVDVVVRDFAVTDGPDLGFRGDLSHTAWIGTADVNQDGLLDVIGLAGHVDGVSGIYIQAADGTFAGRVAGAAGLPARAVVAEAALADADGDGDTDLFIAGEGINGLWMGNGVGAFAERVDSGIPEAMNATGVAVGDVNRDGFIDALYFAGDDSTLLLGDGGGGFVAVVLADVGLDGVTAMRRGQLVDLNGDGVADLVASGDAGASLFIGDRAATFSLAEDASGFASHAAAFMVPIDADKNGHLDVFSAGGGDARVYLSGDPSWSVAARGVEWRADDVAVAVADFNADGRDDLAAAGAQGVRIWQGGDAAFVARNNASIGLPAAGAYTAVAAADMDGDMDFDLLLGGEEGISLLRSNRTLTGAPYSAVRLRVTRARVRQDGPEDAVGVIVDRLGGGFQSVRAMVPPPVGPVIVTLDGPGAAVLGFSFIDKGGEGSNTRLVDGLTPGSDATVHAPE